MRKTAVHTQGRTDWNTFHSGSAELTEVKSGNNVVVQQVSRCERIHTGSRHVVQEGSVFTESLSMPNHMLNLFLCVTITMDIFPHTTTSPCFKHTELHTMDKPLASHPRLSLHNHLKAMHLVNGSSLNSTMHCKATRASPFLQL